MFILILFVENFHRWLSMYNNSIKCFLVLVHQKPFFLKQINSSLVAFHTEKVCLVYCFHKLGNLSFSKSFKVVFCVVISINILCL